VSQRIADEKPGLDFSEYAIALHFVAETDAVGVERKDPSRSDINFKSFEDDILSYAYRATPPFTSEVVDVGESLRDLVLCFPPSISYEAEGERVTLHVAGSLADDRERTIAIRASRTDFSSGVSVLHVVFVPGQPSCTLNEYDIVKLTKLWEHSEAVGMGEHGEAVSMAELLTLQTTDSARRERSVFQLAEEVFRLTGSARHTEDDPRAPRLGSIQLANVREWDAIEASINSLDATSTQDLSVELIGVGGVVQGLLDFTQIGVGELTDVFDLVHVDKRGLLGMHKATIVAIEKSARVYRQTRETLGMSPYLLLPQAVLLHNEWLLHSAEKAAEEAVRAVGAEKGKSLTDKLAGAEHKMRIALDVAYVPNVFHYPAERGLYAQGSRSRALRDRRRKLQGQLAAVSGWWREEIARRRERADDWRNFLLALIGAIGLAAAVYPVLEDIHVGVWPRVVASLVLALLASSVYAWLQWRPRR